MNTRHRFAVCLSLLVATLPGQAQLTVDYFDGQHNASLYDTTAPNNPLTLNVSPGTAYQDGVISGTGAVIKTGAGKISMVPAGGNTYSGGTTVSGGTLAMVFSTDIGTGPLTVTTGGTVEAAGNNPINQTLNLSGGTLRVNGFSSTFQSDKPVVLTNASTIDTNGHFTAFLGLISGTGGITKIGTDTLGLNGTNTYSGGTTVSAGTLRYDSAAALGTGTVTVATGGTLRVESSTSLTQNLHFAGGTVLMSLYNFSNSAPITLSNASTINTTAPTAVFSGVISGTGSLTKINSGPLTLSGANTYSGGTTISAGAVTVSATGLGTGPVNILTGATVASAASLIFGSNVTVSGSGSALNATGDLQFHGAGGASLTVSGGAIAAATHDVDFGAAGGTSGSGTVTGTGSHLTTGNKLLLGYTGSGTLTIENGGVVTTPTFIFAENGGTGILNLNTDGTLEVGGAQGIRTGASVLAFNLAGGTIKVTGTALTTSTPATLTNTSTINTNGLGSTFSGVLSGAGALAKSGAGTLTLSGSNTYAGGTTVSAGTIAITSPANLGGGAVSIVTGGKVDGGSSNLPLNRAVSVNGASSLLTTTGYIEFGSSGTGSLTIASGGAVSAGTSVAFGVSSGTGTGSVTGTNSTLTIGTTLFMGAFNGTGTLSVGTGGTVQAGLLRFGAFGGGGTFNLNSGGTLKVGGTNGIVVTEGTGTFNFNGGILKVTGTNLTTAMPMTLSNPSGIDTNGLAATLSGVLSGAGSITKSGAGTLTLSGANTHSGGAFVSAGTLVITSAQNLGTGPFILAAGILQAGGTEVFSDAVDLGSGTLKVAGSSLTTSRPITLTGGATIIDTNGLDASFSGIVSGIGSFTKSGTGTFTLSAANEYSGGTIVSTGTLQVTNTTGSGTGSGLVSIAAGATLAGSFAIAGATTVDGALTPGGAGVGAANFGSNLTFGSAAVTTINLASAASFDTINIAGTLTLDGTIAITTTGGYIPTRGTTFHIIGWSVIDVSGFNPGTDFNFVGAGGAEYWDTTSFLATGNLVAIPEPSTCAIAIGGLLGVVILLRRRQV